MRFSLKSGVSSCAVALFAVVMSLSSFGCVGGQSEGAFAVDSISMDRNWSLPEPKENDPLHGMSHFTAQVDFPVMSSNGENPLVDSVLTWYSAMLLPGEPVVKNRTLLERAANLFFGDCEGNEWGAEKNITLRRCYDGPDYVSFELSVYTYTGGSRGSCSMMGASFAKSDGHIMGWEHFKSGTSLRKKVTNAIRRQRDEMDDVAFRSQLLGDADLFVAADGSLLLPLPKCTPWLTKQGWAFTYQPCEILPWAYGAVACCLPDSEVQHD